MFNQMTYRLRLVEEEPIQALPLLGRMIYAKAGGSYEIFQDNTHCASVRLPGTILGSKTVPILTQKRVFTGYRILHVNLSAQPYTISGTLTTRENYNRAYEITLELEISNIDRFIDKYRNQNDPAATIIAGFKSWFQQHAAQLEYDKIGIDKIPLDRWNDDSIQASA